MTPFHRQARALALRRHQSDRSPWWMWAALAASLLSAGGVQAQTQAPAVPPTEAPNTAVPEVIAPAIPPGAGGSGATTPQPRSENPLSSTPSSPLPDAGIVVTPPSNSGQTPVIRPPPGITNTPVIPPPGSPGGSGLVVPK